MTKMKIKKEELIKDTVGRVEEFPKYTTQIINLANQNSQGTRPKVVGQMSDLIEIFPGKTYDEWVDWYLQEKPVSIDNATNKVYDMVLKLQEAIKLIDKELIRKWVEDLVLTKIFIGLRFERSILAKIASYKNLSYQLSTPDEESRGIDGYIGNTPISIKPTTYRSKDMLNEQIDVKIVYYEKKKDGITIGCNRSYPKLKLIIAIISTN